MYIKLFLKEINPVKTVLAEWELKMAKNMHDDHGFTINTPLFGYAGAYKGIDFRAIVLVCARSHNGFKPKNSSNDDLTAGDKVLINTFMKVLYG